MTTTEKVKKLVTDDYFNAAFIAQAISEYANKILIHEEEVRKDLANGLIDAEAWINCAKQCEKMFK